MNLNATIVPKSDQLNSDDLITGPRTIRIESVKAGNAENPVFIGFEGDAGRPYKPCKSMRRVIIVLWGSESHAYIGQRLTIYRDPSVAYGGAAVGGIRISHASGITEPVEILLTITRGKKKLFRVEPLHDDAPKLDNIPAGWATWSNEERGDNRAAAGLNALQKWWQELPISEKNALKSRLDNDWKPTAQKVGAA